MSASDYPITFPYGGTDDLYYGPAAVGKPTYIGPYHRGDDRAMPIGMPVLVNNTQIGLAGVSGAASGPHLHIGRFVNGRDTNPNQQGFTLTEPAKVFDTGYNDTDGNYVRLTDSTGVLWVYLHLSHINVKAGDKIGVDEMSLQAELDIMTYKFNESQKALAVREEQAQSQQAQIDLLNYQLGEANKAIAAREAQAADYEKQIADLQSGAGFTPVTETLYRKAV